MFRNLSIAVCALFVFQTAACGQATPASGEDASDNVPVTIPLAVYQTRAGTYKATISIALGNRKALPFGFDTGSSGLHVFADANLDAPGSGVQCTKTPTSVTYGNPARVTLSGVVCYAQLHFEGLSSTAQVPIAYLTSGSCPKTNPGCKIPDLRSIQKMHSYGVFGAGLTGIMNSSGNVPNPILTLSGRRGSVYNVILRKDAGELVLGGDEPANAAEFHLRQGTRPGERYSFPRTCVFVNGSLTDSCLLISFDTGNGVPWFHGLETDAIPQEDGVVKPGTRLGFAPPGDAKEATSVVAGTSFADTIKLVPVSGKLPLTNVSVQAFLDHVFTYDNTRGVIAVAPAP